MLPILGKLEEIIETVANNQVTVIVGETGSGKTTEIPVMLFEYGIGNGRQIGITQPRRIAATSVAEYVAGKLNTELGQKVGYKIRFDDTSSDRTKVKFMTDGILLEEIQHDPDLSRYSVIMIDEAHERSINIDFLLGLLKDLLKRRRDLKLVVTSATIDEQKYSDYFDNAPIINVSGRTFPVEIHYLDSPVWGRDELVDEITSTVMEIAENKPSGDVLIFMTGKDDINYLTDWMTQFAENKGIKDMVMLPVYGDMAPQEQNRIFKDYPGKRKIVIATNIAETSITIDGIVYVIDSGNIKQTNFNPHSGIESLSDVKHSQSGCDQRAGRAGRTQAGVCYRMYTLEDYESRPKFTTPEILRSSLATVVLKMENLEIENIPTFDFIDMPDHAAFIEAYETLIALGAILRNKTGLTQLGKKMARLPLEPKLARMVIEAQEHGCVQEIATIAGFLSVRSIYNRPKGKEYDADRCHSRFRSEHSDLLAFLKVWDQFVASGYSKGWCADNYLNSKAIEEAEKIRHQLLQVLEKLEVEISSITDYDFNVQSRGIILRAVVCGLIYNMFMEVGRGAYAGVIRKSSYDVYIHPSSGLFNRYSLIDKQFIVATEIVKTTKSYARNCTAIPKNLIPELLPDLCEKTERIIKWEQGDSEATMQTTWTFEGTIISQVDTQISIQEASALQDQLIKQGQAKGLVSCVFEDLSTGSYGYERELYAKAGNQIYEGPLVSSVRVIPGDTYLCELKRKVFGDGYRAEPIHRLFNFPKTSVGGNSREVGVSPDALSALADRWGGSFKK